MKTEGYGMQKLHQITKNLEKEVFCRKGRTQKRDALNGTCTLVFSGRDDLLESYVTKCLIN